MAVGHVSTGNAGGSSSAAIAYTAAVGVAVNVGDLIVISAASNGTHVTNGMICSDTKNGTYLVLAETQGGNASSRWLQSFYVYATVALASTDLLTFTPYAASTANEFTIDVYSGTTGGINQSVVSAGGPTGLTASGPALAAPPTAGALVLALSQVGSGTAAVNSPFVVGSTRGTPVCTVAYVEADGSSTYATAWTWGTSNSSSVQTVAFSAAATVPPEEGSANSGAEDDMWGMAGISFSDGSF